MLRGLFVRRSIIGVGRVKIINGTIGSRALTNNTLTRLTGMRYYSASRNAKLNEERGKEGEAEKEAQETEPKELPRLTVISRMKRAVLATWYLTYYGIPAVWRSYWEATDAIYAEVAERETIQTLQTLSMPLVEAINLFDLEKKTVFNLDEVADEMIVNNGRAYYVKYKIENARERIANALAIGELIVDADGKVSNLHDLKPQLDSNRDELESAMSKAISRYLTIESGDGTLKEGMKDVFPKSTGKARGDATRRKD